MIDCRLLMFGKYEESEYHDQAAANGSLVFDSGCYFDWLELYDVTVDGCKGISDIVGRFYEEYSKLRFNHEKHHIHQGVFLISDTDDLEDGAYFDPFKDASMIYVSLINLPMSDDSCFSEQSHIRIENLLKEVIRNYPLRLYNTFDHCDFVLLCNGSKMSLQEYIGLIKNIRMLADKDAPTVRLIHDVTTVYGYKTGNAFFTDESLDVVLSVSNRQPEFSFLLSPQSCFMLQPTYAMELTGRYDNILVYQGLKWQEVEMLIQEARKNIDIGRLFAYRVHVGSKLNSNFEDKTGISPIVSSSSFSLIKKAASIFAYHKEKIRIALDDQKQYVNSLFFALLEVHKSVLSILERDFSQYFVLCFFESFYRFIHFLSEKILAPMGTIENEEEKMRNAELINDLFNSYFSFLRTLNASTLHSERRFIQADPYQLTYFDVPPKLIAFYTAVASQIASEVSSLVRSNNKYTFLITPDFKKNIYVESLTKHRSSRNELNMLIIHIDEKGIYDIPNTIQTIAHEIVHHTGLNNELRKTRAKCYMYCVTAAILSDCANADFFDIADEDDRYSLFVHIVNIMCKLIETYEDESVNVKPFDICETLDDKYLNDYYINSTDIPVYYYTEYFVHRYVKRITECFSHEFFWNMFCDQLKEASWPTNLHFKNYLSNAGGKDDTFPIMPKADSYNASFVQEYAINKFAAVVQENCQNFILNNDRLTKAITYVFSEGIADIYMLNLTSRNHVGEDIARSYIEMLEKNPPTQASDSLRIASVLHHFVQDNYIMNLEQGLTLQQYDDYIYKYQANSVEIRSELTYMFRKYLRECATAFFKKLPAYNDIDQSRDSFYTNIISPFVDGFNVNKVIVTLNRIIHDYRKELVSDSFGVGTLDEFKTP